MPDFSKRSQLPEKMDQPDASADATVQALRELEVINKMLGGYHVVLNALEKLQLNGKEISIMDFGCGGGDMLREIAKWATQTKIKADLIGIDRNPLMTEYASLQSKKFHNIRYITTDVFDEQLLNEKVDITMNSLFCHHFEDEMLIRLVQRMNQISAKAVIINDLHRNWFAYYAIKIITALFSKTELVKYDGPLSVARALKRKEWEYILKEAGITKYSLRWMWAWRWQLIINKQ